MPGISSSRQYALPAREIVRAGGTSSRRPSRSSTPTRTSCPSRMANTTWSVARPFRFTENHVSPAAGSRRAATDSSIAVSDAADSNGAESVAARDMSGAVITSPQTAPRTPLWRLSNRCGPGGIAGRRGILELNMALDVPGIGLGLDDHRAGRCWQGRIQSPTAHVVDQQVRGKALFQQRSRDVRHGDLERLEPDMRSAAIGDIETQLPVGTARKMPLQTGRAWDQGLHEYGNADIQRNAKAARGRSRSQNFVQNDAIGQLPLRIGGPAQSQPDELHSSGRDREEGRRGEHIPRR